MNFRKSIASTIAAVLIAVASHSTWATPITVDIDSTPDSGFLCCAAGSFQLFGPNAPVLAVLDFWVNDYNESFDIPHGSYGFLIEGLVRGGTSVDWSLAHDGNTVAGGNFTNNNQRTKFFIDGNKFAVVPEPGTLALLGMGLLGLSLARLRRKNG